MEANVWTDSRVFNHLKDDFVMLQLVVDDKTALAPSEQFVSTYSGKKITTLGNKASDLEREVLTHTSPLPFSAGFAHCASPPIPFSFSFCHA